MGKLNCCESFTLFLLRYVLAIPVLICFTPFRMAFDFFTMHHPKICRSRNTPEKHGRKVKDVQAQVQEWNQNGRNGLMCTGRPTWQSLALRNYNKGTMTQIYMDLEEIIEIDTKNKVLRVEPGMKMGTLTSKLVPLGWTIPVVPELESLTIGGCICGAGLETSSHKYGLFSDTCLSFEMVLADGSLVTCSKTENSDLFHAIPMSHGTIGFLTAVTFPLIQALKYVKVEYIHTKTIEEASELMLAHENEFIEGIMYDLNNSVMMLGNFVNDAPTKKVNSVLKWYKPWFFKHVESFLNKPGQHIEYIPTRDYYHRHQRAYFWEAAIGMPFGNHPLFRYTLGWVFPVNFQLMKLLLPIRFLDITLKHNHVLQDFVLPLSKLRASLEFSHDEVEIYPLWLCPVMPSEYNLAHYTGLEKELYIDIGIYGESPKYEGFDAVKTTRKFEKFTIENKGFQAMYADVYLTREEFEQMFNLSLYNKVRADLRCGDAFPHIYDKISRVARGI